MNTGNGGSPGQIALSILNYLGGAAGGEIVAAAVVIVGILAACHVCSGHHIKQTIIWGGFGWAGVYIISTILGWGAVAA